MTGVSCPERLNTLSKKKKDFSVTTYIKKKNIYSSLGCGSLVECFPSRHAALGSILSTTKLQEMLHSCNN